MCIRDRRKTRFTILPVRGIMGISDTPVSYTHLYVHADHQNQGVATAICDALEQTAPGNITTHASITARPFFEKRGYKVIKEQLVERQGIFLTNFVMEKEMTPDEGKNF